MLPAISHNGAPRPDSASATATAHPGTGRPRFTIPEAAAPWWPWVALALITALAAALRFWDLARTPPGFHYDEAYEALEAWRVLTQPGYHPIFFPGNFGVEPLFIYLASLAFRLFGASPLAMRAVAAAAGTLTVPLTYLLGRELVAAEPRIPAGLPLLAALALATLRWHLLFSRVGIEPVLVPLFLVLVLWSFWWGLRTNRAAAWLVLGLALGLAPYTYPAGRLLPFLALATVALVWLAERDRLRGRWTGLLAAAGVALVVVAPLAWHFAHHRDQLLLRSSQIAAVQHDIGAAAQAQPGIGDNLVAVAGMFSFHGDDDPRSNVPGLPALDGWSSLAFYLGLAGVLWRWRRPALSGLLLAGVAMLVPTIFSEHAPHFRRALGATPVVALLAGLGVAYLWAWGRAWPPRLLAAGRRAQWAVVRQVAAARPAAALARGDLPRSAAQGAAVLVCAAVLLGGAYASVAAYFGQWAPDPALYYAYDQGLWEIGQYVRSLPAGERIYVSPRPAGDMTLAFAWRAGPAVRHFDGRHAFAMPAYAATGGHATYVIIEHEDKRGGKLLRQLYPQAAEAHIFRDRRGHVYARAYGVAGVDRLGRRPQHLLAAAWADAGLIGYDIDRPAFRPGDTIYLQLWWRSLAPARADWTVFTHLAGRSHTGADGHPTTRWAGHDGRPGEGSARVTTWAPGDVVLDEHRIPVPPETPPGSYHLQVGLYDQDGGGRRAPLVTPTASGGDDSADLGTVEIN